MTPSSTGSTRPDFPCTDLLPHVVSTSLDNFFLHMSQVCMQSSELHKDWITSCISQNTSWLNVISFLTRKLQVYFHPVASHPTVQAMHTSFGCSLLSICPLCSEHTHSHSWRASYSLSCIPSASKPYFASFFPTCWNTKTTQQYFQFSNKQDCGKLQIQPYPSKNNHWYAWQNTRRYLLAMSLHFINFLHKVLFYNHAN